ncbi:glutamyl-tRNA synthetase [Litoreibacter ascidiaceicola]|uniref:Glutamate--tRNA ligase n=1 Tax=Litoreibacter ascidiaceicola TaxID=1486859 RepID=A0A1M4W2B7_9RHOB|nr:glutamate--tRNA ligase [Litoreibacter ascidiaceicola]SHE75424.1 glutamyl-tRNA synthetase [Litoreibacter ascidiaceicola]
MTDAPVVTRFAPSPTGYLHIGGARTALFNWLYARGRGGKFLLRIEDTDRARYTPEATQAILDGLTWLGLDWDGDAVSQFESADRHAAVAHEMLAAGTAYKCFASQDEIEAFREAARADGRSTLYRSPWRDVPESEHPDAPFAIRIKAPQEGDITIQDAVQGDVTWKADALDDMVLLRSDGSPVYMLAVVVDDHDMGVTHVIRGDDHLANAARQSMIYTAMGWDLPVFAHIPLIHGPDGKKLSKRHGALGVMEYAAMGYTPAGMRNYLARLGWSHGDDEVFTTKQALEWFDLDGIGKAPARLDFKKMENINRHQIGISDSETMVRDVQSYLTAVGQPVLSDDEAKAFADAFDKLDVTDKTVGDLLAKFAFVLDKPPFTLDEKAEKLLDPVSRGILTQLTPQLQTASWNREALEQTVMEFAEAQDLKFGKLAGPLRVVLSGRAVSPSVFDMMMIIGRDETLARLAHVVG